MQKANNLWIDLKESISIILIENIYLNEIRSILELVFNIIEYYLLTQNWLTEILTENMLKKHIQWCFFISAKDSVE